ncbi:MAG: nucleotidyltransferase domain-containing protein [Methanotrichaceae archaeon]|nr:nucleotidyltransferase domain-containing protein [Methanotrichaceae archaeon]
MQSRRAEIERALQVIMALGGEKVKFVILYGSTSREEARPDSDIDICVYYDDLEGAMDFRLQVMSELFEEIYDIRIFQHLPLPLKIEVLKGKVLFCPDLPFLYDLAYQTVKEFDSFKHRYYDYIGIEAIR